MQTNNDIPDWRITGLVGPMQLRYRLPMQFRVGPYVRILVVLMGVRVDQRWLQNSVLP